MDSLFGMSTDLIARVFAGLTATLLSGLTVLAVRRRVLLKLGLRNAARRPLRSLVIVVGLMLSTVVIATAFTTGDAMTLTIRSLVTGAVGQVDEVVTGSSADVTQVSAADLGTLVSGGTPSRTVLGYFPGDEYQSLQYSVRGSRAIAGMMPVIQEHAAVEGAHETLAHPNVGVLGVPTGDAPGFGTLRDTSGRLQTVAALGEQEVLLNAAAADLLGASAGHTLRAFLSAAGASAGDDAVEHDFIVRAVLQNGVLAGPEPAVLLPLPELQSLVGQAGRINEILVVNRCGSNPTACSGQAALDLRKALIDPTAAESVRRALAGNGGRGVLSALAARRTGRGRDQILDLERTAAKGHLTDHFIYLLGDPQVAGTLRATAGFLPVRNGRLGRTVRSLNPLTVVEVKRGALNVASDYASILTSSFLVLGLFSITASLLLVFLVFVMLAAERRGEMGIARAVGLRRAHLVQSFTFEGVVYDLAAALLGAGAGVIVSMTIVWLVGRALAGHGVPVQRHVESRSLVIAFCAGVVVTFVTVVFSAWRVSRLGIVEAIRGIDDEARLDEGLYPAARRGFGAGGAGLRALALGRLRTGSSLLWLAAAGVRVLFHMLIVRGLVPFAAGYFLFETGGWNGRYLAFAAGASLMIVGGALLLRWLLLLARQPGGRADRIAYTLAGAGLTVFWAVPPPALHGRYGHFAVGSIETFALSGVMMVLGLVWVVAYNIAGPLRFVARLAGRGGALTVAVKMAVAYPLQHRFRTGMAVAMFSLVIFTMVLAAVLLDSAHNAYLTRERPPAGYDISATAPEQAGLADMASALAQAPASRADEFDAVGSVETRAAMIIEPSGNDATWHQTAMHLVDDGFAHGIRLRLSARAHGYSSDGAVWDALVGQPHLALVARSSLPAFGDLGSAVIGRVSAQDNAFVPEGLWVREGDAAPVRLTVIGVVDDPTALPSGVLTPASNIGTPAATSPVPTAFLFKTRSGRDPQQAALGLELSFGGRGLQTDVVGEGLRNVETVRSLLNYLLEGFVGLGLVSGMAALGVISTRSVVERRQQIGMMRAIGLRRRLVQTIFLLEVSFVALLGVVVGVALGILLAHNVVAFLQPGFRELRLTIPWAEVALVAAIAFFAALSSTLVAAWQSGRIDPAEALRYE